MIRVVLPLHIAYDEKKLKQDMLIHRCVSQIMNEVDSRSNSKKEVSEKK